MTPHETPGAHFIHTIHLLTGFLGNGDACLDAVTLHPVLNALALHTAGNFLTLQQGVQLFGADAMRIAFADAGDAIDDANFVSTTANSAILRLTKELAWIQEVLEAQPSMRRGQKLFADRVFANEISHAAHKTREVRSSTNATLSPFLLAKHFALSMSKKGRDEGRNLPRTKRRNPCYMFMSSAESWSHGQAATQSML